MSETDQTHNFTQDPLDVSTNDSTEHLYSKSDDEEEKRDTMTNLTRIGSKNEKKTVSIAPHSKVQSETLLTTRPPADSMQSESETTPLLHPCSSLPTVVGYDESIDEYPGPSTTTRSEIGRSELVRKRKKRRQRYNTIHSGAQRFKPRPFLISPFMPIPTQITIDNIRTGDRNVENNRASYGSTTQNLLPRESSGESESDEEESVATSEEKSTLNIFHGLTSREYLTIAMLCIANLCSTIAFSCIAPFYPQEAKMKDLSETQIGAVFGIFEFTMFIASPLFGKWILKIGAKQMFIVGIVVTGVTAILFGFLNFLPSGNIFFTVSMIIRFLEALGDAAFVTSSFAISAKNFPNNIAMIIGLLETFAGFGYTAGPVIGGFLYDIGGFQLPFLVLGFMLCVAAVLAYFLIENVCDADEEEGKGILAMLRISAFWVPIFSVIACAISLSFLDPTLSGHLSSFNLTSTQVGLMFLLCGGSYTITAPMFGALMDSYHCGNFSMLFGAIATILSMIFIGPTPLVGDYISKDLWVIGIALTVLGIAASALYIPCFQTLLDSAKSKGFDDNFHTYGCVSGIFQAAFGFGSFVGPTLGSVLSENVGFPWTTTIIAFLHVSLLLILIFNIVRRRCCSAD